LENDTLAFYSQMTILALAKDKAQDFTLYELALKWGILHQGGVNNIVANRDSQYVVEQVSWALKGVRVDGRDANLTLQRWALFAEGPALYYIVEVDYVPAVNQSAPVWDDLQAYLDAFRVIQ
jgi:ribonuclease HI